MANTLRVSIQPNNGATRVIRIAQPSLRVTISKGGGAALPIEKTFGAAKVYGSLVKGYAANGLPNADTQAAIDYALAQGYPAWSIIWVYQGEAVAGSVSSTATVPAFSAWVTFTPPSVTATAVSEAVSASATIPALTALASFTAPTVTGNAGVTATASVPQFSAVSTFAAPTVYATRNATATVPQFAASATFSAPNVTVTPAGATAASVTVPSFGAVATFAAPNVTAQRAATASVPSFSALASLSAPSVMGVAQTLATVTVPQFAATSTFTAPAVSAQKVATAAVPSLSATSTLTAPTVAATRVATASVPSFGATAAFIAPTVAGVQQAAAVSATATVPSLTARATLTAPSATGTTVTASLPAQVTGVSASNSPAQITVTWSAVSGATSYNVYYSAANNSAGATKISGITDTSKNINGTLTAGTTYYVWVSAQNVAGEGPLSASASAVAGALAATSVSDNFNRADGGLGSNWTTVTGKEAPVISSQKVFKSGLALTHATYWSSNTFANDQWAIARVYPETYYGIENDAANSLAAGPSVRASAAAIGWHTSVCNFNDMGSESSGFIVTIWENGVYRGHYTSYSPDEYTHIKITAVGTAITVYGGQSSSGPWTELTSAIDVAPLITSGSAGITIGGFFTLASVDDWSGGDI